MPRRIRMGIPSNPGDHGILGLRGDHKGSLLRTIQGCFDHHGSLRTAVVTAHSTVAKVSNPPELRLVYDRKTPNKYPGIQVYK